MSDMKQIIIDIENRLTEKVSELQYIAENWGQLDLYADHPPVKFPCALVDITSASFSNAGNKLQEGNVSIVITVADMSNLVSRKAPTEMKMRALKIYDIVKDINKALHGWSGNNAYAKLMRTSYAKSTREDGARLHTVTYTTTCWDNSAQTEQNAVVNEIEINQTKLGV